MRHARLVVDPLSTHATVLEHPERVLGEVRTFVELEAPRLARLSSFDFGRKEQSPRGVGGSLSDID